MSKATLDLATLTAFLASQGIAMPTANATAASPAIATRSKKATTPKPAKAFGGRTWSRLADVPSQFPGYPASAVYVSSTQPNKPRYIPLDLVAAIKG